MPIKETLNSTQRSPIKPSIAGFAYTVKDPKKVNKHRRNLSQKNKNDLKQRMVGNENLKNLVMDNHSSVGEKRKSIESFL